MPNESDCGVDDLVSNMTGRRKKFWNHCLEEDEA
jgi:hypothetical protein